jgi:cytochrome c-type biogenesis protein CcmH/NrfF
MRWVACAALASLTLIGCSSDETPNSAKAVEERLTCQCGCGLTVHTCNHLQCSFGVPVKKDVAESLAAGQSGEAILARYVAQYGEKILSSPTHRGFNLLAWYGPYAAVLLSALLLVFMLRRWRRGSAGTDGDAQSDPLRPDVALSEAQRNRLQRELDRLSR